MMEKSKTPCPVNILLHTQFSFKPILITVHTGMGTSEESGFAHPGPHQNWAEIPLFPYKPGVSNRQPTGWIQPMEMGHLALGPSRGLDHPLPWATQLVPEPRGLVALASLPLTTMETGAFSHPQTRGQVAETLTLWVLEPWQLTLLLVGAPAHGKPHGSDSA